MLCVVPVIGAQAEETFSSQLKTDIGLFRIDDPHKAGQEFVLDFAQMQTVRAYLEMENPNTTVTVSIHSSVNEAPIRSQSFTFQDALSGWITMTMDEPLSLTKAERYTLVLTSNAKVLEGRFPKSTATTLGTTMRRLTAGGNQEPYSTAFEILPPPASWEVVTQSIAALPDEITLDNADAVAAVRRAYDALSESDKALVTNYERLTAAEAVILNLQQLIYTSQNSAPNALFQCRAPSGGGQEFRPDFTNLTKVTSYLEIQEETDITLTIWKGYPHEGAVALYSQTYHMAQQPAGWD